VWPILKGSLQPLYWSFQVSLNFCLSYMGRNTRGVL
jgi:hypothetical protein